MTAPCPSVYGRDGPASPVGVRAATWTTQPVGQTEVVGGVSARGSSNAVVRPEETRHPRIMIVTHAQNARGQRRVYLGGKASLECWIEPTGDGQTWRFHMAAAVTGNAISPADQRQWAMHILMQLAETLNIPPRDLASVPFEAIAGLHTGDPFAGRRIATPRRTQPDQAFMSTAPDIRRPARDFDLPGSARPLHR